MGGIDIRFQREDSQRCGFRVQLPGRIQHLDVLHHVLLICGHLAVSQWKSTEACCMPQLDGDICIVVGEIGECRGSALEKRRLGRGLLHLHGQQVQRLCREDVAPAGARQTYLLWLLL